MGRIFFSIVIILFCTSSSFHSPETSWIRINQLGYLPAGIKVAVFCSKEKSTVKNFQLFNAVSGKIVFTGSAGKAFGAYGPFAQTFRLNFSSFIQPGRYYLQAAGARSPVFEIGNDVYKGAADFCLRYMRQQRSGFNPFLKDSCHTHDGYVLYGQKAGIPDSTHIDVSGGWHDASDYLQYSTTSANATYHLLMAYRDFPAIFSDEKQSNGIDGKNGLADVVDEAKWGLDWLLKMHPKDEWMFNQLADDRDHMGMRIPKEDSFYGKGFERPVYFLSGEPQQRGKFMNNTTGTSSTAGKFSSAFSLGFSVFKNGDVVFAKKLLQKANTAFQFGLTKQGVSQTASVRSPYIYAEDNWADDMELAAVQLHNALMQDENEMDLKNKFRQNELLERAANFSRLEPLTPWLGSDTAKHYQWYPFINIGHYELAKHSSYRKKMIELYKTGIEKVWSKARTNAFYRGVPFIWCSNNLTTSFAIQCYWYKNLSGDKMYAELEQANFDWLFGCNPWGTSMVYGLPSWGDTPVDPHSAFTHLKNYPIDGGLVDGPVYGSIYKNLIGIQLKDPDEYAEFQSDLAVYHDDYGDYSSNEPTMDGTASLIYLLAAKEAEANKQQKFRYDHGAIIRGDSAQKNIALVFTGDEFSDGGNFIAETLAKEKIKVSFFLTGNFYENPANQNLLNLLAKGGHFLGNHSYRHLLYCDWNDRKKTLVSKNEFREDVLDITAKLEAVNKLNGDKRMVSVTQQYFLPPYEWFNDTIAKWTTELGKTLINYTPGTLSHADYTTPGMKNYRTSEAIFESITRYEQNSKAGLSGFMLLSHIGTDPQRTDKFYKKLPALIRYLKQNGYRFVTVDRLLKK